MGSVAAAHLVQFYGGAERLAESLSSGFADSLTRGEAVVVVAAPDHRDALDSALADAGVNLAAEYRSGRYQRVDVAQVLERFMTPTGPDAGLFRSAVGDTIDDARRRTGTVNAYGELVGLLAERGDLPAALEVETLLDRLVQRHPFRLRCGYPREIVNDAGSAFDTVCAVHDAVVVNRDPPEPALSATLDLPLRPDAAAIARQATQDVLSAWGAGDSASIADAGLVVSELIGAAVRANSARVSFSLGLDAGHVVLSVTDAEHRHPEHVSETELTAAGRSFALLTSLAQAWGVEAVEEGTRIWARMHRSSV